MHAVLGNEVFCSKKRYNKINVKGKNRAGDGRRLENCLDLKDKNMHRILRIGNCAADLYQLTVKDKTLQSVCLR